MTTEIPGTVVLPPQTALQLGAGSLNQVTAALGTQPLLLVIVLLNMTFAGLAGYFMLQLEGYRAENLSAIIGLVRECVLNTAPLASTEAKAVKELEELINSNKGEMERNRLEIERLRGGTPAH